MARTCLTSFQLVFLCDLSYRYESMLDIISLFALLFYFGYLFGGLFLLHHSKRVLGFFPVVKLSEGCLVTFLWSACLLPQHL